ncbi:sugar ABC transporter permease [Spiractinospora alimapuensis]|uniref:sugar ABC transporter permease n=1 Tax=Spiractinospora alimapuensis TaxID=2820884 RepID=UPI001F2DFCA1|nr:sugar ABC transporter permease [Spiractinospora alimapuensis]QVQ52403.1 sugar ABC transporter permease [Spiractinospora alimapuensis]
MTSEIQSTPANGSGRAADPRLVRDHGAVGGIAASLVHRIRGGELGPLPVIAGLAVIAVVFQYLNSSFLTPQNISNIAVQLVGYGLLSSGVIMVLLLGEIDLSIGSLAGVSGAVLAVLTVNMGLSDLAGIILAVVVGAAIGALHGTVFAKLGVPAFVVTLAGLLGWKGAHLYILGAEGTINIPRDGLIASLTKTYFTPAYGWAIGVAAVLVFLAATVYGEWRRVHAGLEARSAADVALRTTVLAVPVLGGVYVLNLWNGVPLAFLIFVGFVVVFDIVLRRTRYGRMVFAVGGNAEAARRAGINVDLVRISCFTLSSTLAAIGGVMIVSRNNAVSQQTGGDEVLMFAIAAAVIGGTSLFGGRGSAYSALLGMLVIQAITAGLFLMQMSASVRFMITAVVLLVAVVLDAMTRRSRRVHARGG